MKCPYCDQEKTRVIDTTHDTRGGTRRRRVCDNCQQRFSSYERPILATPLLVKKDGTRPVPMHLRNAPTQLMKQLDYGKGYRYAHDEEDGFAAGERYLPDGMPEPGFYKPVRRGLEIKIADKLEELRKKNAATG